ncbi:MAG: polysaccharide biosynthesis protein [Prevotellaceae bacterium]|nr:polysaccharide biosynthesis protein [Prevotellaceae bacterium]
MASLKKNLSYAFGAQGLQLLRSILISLILPKIMGVEDFGFWQLFIFYTQYGGFLHMGLIDGMYLREGGKHYEDLDYRQLGVQLRYFIIWQSAIILPFIYLGITNSDTNRTFVIIASCVYVIVNNIMTYLMYVLQAVNRIKESSIGKTVITILFVLLVIILLTLKTNDFKPYIIGYIFCYLCAQLYYVVKTREIIASVFSKSMAEYKYVFVENLKSGIILMFSNISGMLILGIARFAVDQTWGIKVFSIVSFALMFVNFFLMFVNQASMVLFPELKRWDNKKINAFYDKGRNALSMVLPGALVMYYPITILIHYWLPKYDVSVEYLVYLLPICIFDSKMNLLCNTLFKVYNKIKILLFCNVTALIASCFLIYVSIFYTKEISAVVVSMLIAIAIRSIIAEIVLNKMLINQVLIKSLIYECLLITVFVMTNMFVTKTTAFVIYGIAYVAYITSKRIYK